MDIHNRNFDMSLNTKLLDNLMKYLNYENGIYFEAGANEGTRQSNTYLLEKDLNWTGILVEPSQYYNLISKNRPNSIAFNCALVSNDWKNDYIMGNFRNIESDAYNLMSKTEQSPTFLLSQNCISVSAMTMDEVISKTNFIDFDIISLDCEGSEYSILNGFNFEKYSTKYFLIESWIDTVGGDYEQFNKIHKLLTNKGYILECMLTSCDWLYKKN
jgi:FkbM family methyltransferase